MECGPLDENGPHKLIYLNSYSPGSGTAGEGLRDMSLLE